MAKLQWDQEGERLYETGTKNGVVYPKKTDGTYDKGVAWNGLTAFNENPSGAEESALYADDIKYLGLRSAEEAGFTIEAYTYPDEFEVCDGSADIAPGVTVGQQTRRGFGFCCRTTLGNDTMNDDYGYKLHIYYNCMAAPSAKSFATVNDSPEAITFSWEVTTTKVQVPNVGTGNNIKKFKPTAVITIDSTEIDSEKLKAIEAILYGTDGDSEANPAVEATDPRLPLPAEIIRIMES